MATTSERYSPEMHAEQFMTLTDLVLFLPHAPMWNDEQLPGDDFDHAPLRCQSTAEHRFWMASRACCTGPRNEDSDFSMVVKLVAQTLTARSMPVWQFFSIYRTRGKNAQADCS